MAKEEIEKREIGQTFNQNKVVGQAEGFFGERRVLLGTKKKGKEEKIVSGMNNEGKESDVPLNK
jgi:hypothetical protein